MKQEIIYSTAGDAMHTAMLGVYRWGFMSSDTPSGLYRVQLGIQAADIMLMLSREPRPAFSCYCVVDNFGNLVKVKD